MLLTSTSATRFHIPDTLRNWPWSRQLNPHYTICKSESSAWFESFQAFSPTAQKAFNRCDLSLLASLSYPDLDKDGCRVACNLMNVLFLFDEHSDFAHAKEVRQQADTIMDALHNPSTPRPEGEWIGGEITRQFWENAIKIMSRTAQRRFIDTCQSYTDSVVQQAADRDEERIHNTEHYLKFRQDTSGARPCLAILEAKMDLPDEVLNHISIVTLTSITVDLISIGNDLLSYNVEQARGDWHNLVTIVMHERGCDLDSALEWISELHDQLADKFLSTLKEVPSWGNCELDKQLSRYVDGLGNWVRANDSWSFESERYFGEKGPEVQKTKVVNLLPREYGHPAQQFGSHPNSSSS